jgi:tetratricopeptide (TPR) repeat protein
MNLEIQAGLDDVRAELLTLRKKLDAAEKDRQEWRTEMTAFGSQLTELHRRLEAVACELQRGVQTLGAASTVAERALEEERQQHTAWEAEVERQHQHWRELAEALRAGQRRAADDNEAALAGDATLAHQVERGLGALADGMRQGGELARHQIEQLRAAIEQLAGIEQSGLDGAARALAQVEEGERGLVEALGAVGSAAARLVAQTGEIVGGQREAEERQARSEAQRENELGLQRLAEGDWAGAIARFEVAAGHVPSALAPRFNLAYAHYGHGNPIAALEVLAPLASEFPGETRIGFLRGLLCLAQGDVPGARLALSEVAGAEVEDAAVLTAAGCAHLLGRDPGAAVDAFRRAVLATRSAVPSSPAAAFGPRPGPPVLP